MSVICTNEPPPFGNFARQMGKLVDQFQKGYYNFMPSESWTPNVNLYETESAYLVCVDLAGVDMSSLCRKNKQRYVDYTRAARSREMAE